jgi:hypothetical protein
VRELQQVPAEGLDGGFGFEGHFDGGEEARVYEGQWLDGMVIE